MIRVHILQVVVVVTFSAELSKIFHGLQRDNFCLSLGYPLWKFALREYFRVISPHGNLALIPAIT